MQVYPLVANTSYWVYLVCRDMEGGWLASDTINFTTGNIQIYRSRARARILNVLFREHSCVVKVVLQEL